MRVQSGYLGAVVNRRCFGFSLFGLPVGNRLKGYGLVAAAARRCVSSVPVDDKLQSLYRDLNDREYEVRLLELYEPPEPDSGHAFQCRLVYRTLKEPPTYDALSYFWGDLKHRGNLVVDEVPIQISVNLLSALQQLWRMGKTRIWVDYLCINQADNHEKSGQVRMMDTIFAKARTVFGWLGVESHDSDLAMAVLGASKLSEQMELPEEVEIACDAVIRLFSRPYWTRCWVIQEICRARAPTIICGRRYVHWGTMMRRLDRLGTSVPAQYAQYLIEPLRRMRYRDQNRFRADTETGLIPLLIASRRSLASDPRDKLFALLSLAKDGRVLVPTPNYSQTVEQIFHSTAKCMMSEHDRTDVILLAHRTRGARDLPSWMPDWANMNCHPPPWVVECLNQPRPRLAMYNRIRNRILETQGYCQDTITRILDIAYFENGEPEDSGTAAYATSECIVDTLCMGMTMGNKEADHKQITLVHTLMDMCESNASHGWPFSRLAHWISDNCNKRIGAYTLKQHIERYTQHSAGNDPSLSPEGLELDDIGSLEQVRLDMEEGFETMERLRMKFAVTETGTLRIVYRDAEPGDKLYILQNCPLPVVLRKSEDPGVFTFVGEVFCSQIADEKASRDSDDNVTVCIA